MELTIAELEKMMDTHTLLPNGKVVPKSEAESGGPKIYTIKEILDLCIQPKPELSEFVAEQKAGLDTEEELLERYDPNERLVIEGLIRSGRASLRRIGELEKEVAENQQPHKCKGCDELIYYQSYCKRCNRQWES